MIENKLENLSFNSWNEEDKPREKLLQKGKHALTDAELIAILLRTGTKNLNVLELSKILLSDVNNDLNELGKKSVKELLAQKKFRGLGETKAITLLAALELGRRRQKAEAVERKKIICSRDAFEIFQTIINNTNEEQFALLLVNQANKLIGTEIVSLGGRTYTVADPRIIFKSALLANATSIFLGHNHPSGNTKPSQADITLTNKIKEAGKLLEIQLLDHIIVTDTAYFSFADEGMI